MMCLQRIEVVTRLDRVRNEDICEAKWKKKLEGLHGGRLVKQVYEGNVVGRRPRG